MTRSNRIKREDSLQITENPLQEHRNQRPPFASFQVFWWSVRHESSKPRSRSLGRPQTSHFRTNPHPQRVLPVSSARSCGKVSLRLRHINGPWKSFLAQRETDPGDSSPLILRHLALRGNTSLANITGPPSLYVTSGHLGGWPVPDVMLARSTWFREESRLVVAISSLNNTGALELGRCSVLNRVGNLATENASRPIKFRHTTT